MFISYTGTSSNNYTFIYFESLLLPNNDSTTECMHSGMTIYYKTSFNNKSSGTVHNAKRNERRILFNGALTTFYLQLYGAEESSETN